MYKAERYDVKGKQHLKSLEKYYAVDIGRRKLLLGKKNMDIDHILENIVFLELIFRQYKSKIILIILLNDLRAFEQTQIAVIGKNITNTHLFNLTFCR